MNPEVLKFVLGEILKLTHPLCPFITEKLWHELFEPTGSLMNQDFPSLNFEDAEAVGKFNQVQNVVSGIRQIRADQGVNPKDKIAVFMTDQALEDQAKIIELLANLSAFKIVQTVPDSAIKLVIDGLAIFVDIPVDEAAEAARLKKEKSELEAKIKNLEGRLSNKSYTEKAPAHLVEQTRSELDQAKDQLSKIL